MKYPGQLGEMRKAVNMRFDPDLLSLARLQAFRENRSLTNFIETVVRQSVASSSPDAMRPSAAASLPELTVPLIIDQDR